MQLRFLFQKAWIPQPDNNLPTVYDTHIITVLPRACQWSLPCTRWIHSKSSHCNV